MATNEPVDTEEWPESDDVDLARLRPIAGGGDTDPDAEAGRESEEDEELEDEREGPAERAGRPQEGGGDSGPGVMRPQEGGGDSEPDAKQ